MQIRYFANAAVLLVLSCASPGNEQSNWHVLMNRADSLFAEGRFLESALTFDSASQVSLSDSISIHRIVAVASCALSYVRADELSKADSLFGLAVMDPKAWQGQDNLLLNSYLEYAELKASIGDARTSADLFTSARILSERMPDVDDSVRYYIKFSETAGLIGLGRFSDAKIVSRSLYGDAVFAYGRKHEKTILALETYLTCMTALEEYAETEKLLVAAIWTLEEAQLVYYQTYPRFYELLGFVRYRQGETVEGFKAYRTALEVAVSILGADHHDTKTIRMNYANVLRESGSSSLADSVENHLIP